MSSNIRLQKVCEECGKEFVAKTTVTRFCSHQCNSRNYKRGKREHFLDIVSTKEREQRAYAATNPGMHIRQSRKRNTVVSEHLSTKANPLKRELLDIQELTLVIGMSERSIYRMLKNPMFPRIRIGKRVLFIKEEVLHYLTTKTQNNERQTTGETPDKRQDSAIY